MVKVSIFLMNSYKLNMGLGDEANISLMKSCKKKFQKEIILKLNQSLFTQKLWKTNMWLWAQLLDQIPLQNQVDLLNQSIKLEQSNNMKEMSTSNKKQIELTFENHIKTSFNSIQIYGTKNLKLSLSLIFKTESLKFVAKDLETVFAV